MTEPSATAVEPAHPSAAMMRASNPVIRGLLRSPAGGHVTRMRGQLVDDPEAAASLYASAIDHLGVKRAQRMLGLKIHTPEPPAAEALAEAARRYHLSAIQLTVSP